MNSTPNAPRHPRSLDLAKHRRPPAAPGWTPWPGWSPNWPATSWPTSPGSPRTINALAKRIGDRVRAVAPRCWTMPGCGELTAAKLVGETAGVTRFKSEAAFARHAGVAPIPVWSGNTAGRVRMTRSGNRQLNAALHRIAVTQIRLDGLGQTYYRKRLDAGDSTTEALRCLKRRLARVVFHHLHTDQQNRQTLANRQRLDIGETRDRHTRPWRPAPAVGNGSDGGRICRRVYRRRDCGAQPSAGSGTSAVGGRAQPRRRRGTGADVVGMAAHPGSALVCARRGIGGGSVSLVGAARLGDRSAARLSALRAARPPKPG